MRRAIEQASRELAFQSGKEALQLLRDPRSSSDSLSRAIERAPQLMDAIVAYAQVQFRARGRIYGPRDAITLIGLNQLEHIIFQHLKRIQMQAHPVTQRTNHRIEALRIALPTIEANRDDRRYANR
jgi:hypothetical protein